MWDDIDDNEDGETGDDYQGIIDEEDEEEASLQETFHSALGQLTLQH